MTDCVYLCLIIIPKFGDNYELPFELCCREKCEQNSHMLDCLSEALLRLKNQLFFIGLKKRSTALGAQMRLFIQLYYLSL